MTNFVSILKQCEAATGSGSKKVIAGLIAQMDIDAQRLTLEALTAYRVFGIKKYVMPSVYASEDAYIDVFFSLLDDLHDRHLTGHAARTSITNVLSLFTQETSWYLAKILDKSLKCGFSEDTFNKVWPDNQIPTFKVMLADKYDTDEEVMANISNLNLVEAKYDGERTIAIVSDGNVKYYSRSGKVAEHVSGLFDAELLCLRDDVGEDIIVDGERYASNFKETINAKKEGNDFAKSQLRFYAFTYMSLVDWMSKKTALTQIGARNDLIERIARLNLKKISISTGKVVNSPAEAKEFYHEMVALGYEGLILKDPNAVYEWKRCKSWLKWKPFFDFDGTVIGLYAGNAKTARENSLGGLIFEGYDEQGRHVITKVGNGWTDEERDHIFNNSHLYIGRTGTISYQEMSEAEGKPGVFALRFSSFEHWRDDK